MVRMGDSGVGATQGDRVMAPSPRPNATHLEAHLMTTQPLDHLSSAEGADWRSLGRNFAAADWSFEGATRSPGGELHPYPARFIPALPRQVLDLLQPSGTVLDPFCGSGTTLLEARRRGLAAVGNDLNPIACLISRVRTSEWHKGDAAIAARHASKLADAALQWPPETPMPLIPRLDHWFEPWAQGAMAGAVGYLSEIPREDPWHDRIALAISSCVVKISRQDSDTRYAAVEKQGDRLIPIEGVVGV